MKIENNNNYYNVEDEINFEKLKNFRKFNSNVKSITQSNDRNIRYANSDKNYFNNIIKTDENLSLSKKIDTEKEVKYYNSSDFQKFDQFNNFLNYEDKAEQKLDKNIDTEKEVKYYNSSDFQKFDQFNNFLNYEDKAEQKLDKNIDTEFNYSSNDYGEFNKIIPIKNSAKKIISNKNSNVKIIDYSKLNDDKKKLKNKLQIEKIKIVYFD